MPSGKAKLKISFLAEEFPNCHTKPLYISSTRETRSEQTVLLAVSLTSKGLSQPIPGWAGPSGERHVPCSKQQEETLLTLSMCSSNLSPIPLRCGSTFCTRRDPRTRKTAPAAGRSWCSSRLEARAAPLMPCQQWPPPRKPGVSHATGTRTLPIRIETFRWNCGGFLPALPFPFLHSNSRELQVIRQRGSKYTRQTWEGSANRGFALKSEPRGC